MNNADPAGLLITVDGQSGAGKTTTAALLATQLEAHGRRVLLTRTPSSSCLGALARHGTFDFRGRELTLLVAADRFHHDRSVIRPAVADGALVICDRYVASSLVLDPLDGADRDLVWAIYRHLAPPDLSIILTGDPARCTARAVRRGHYSRFHSAEVVANERELSGFLDAADFLRQVGHRVLEHDIGTASAREVAEQLATVILAMKGGRQ
ncbi:dTMP kinase [Micromonospora sp. CPCC 206060]|uniref:dTMP kinase n=1 Tax=Micromonospora sp. CPCC 206060 TaxID=3122406 RepID=UPI002FF0E179